MAKVTLGTLASLANQTSAVTTINDNSTLIETAIENTISRDGTSPNTMGASLDMNSNRILNLPAPTSNLEPMRLVDFTSAAVVHGTSVVTPGTTTSQALVRWGATDGTTLSNSGATLDNSNNLSIAALTTSGITNSGNSTNTGNLTVTGTSTQTGAVTHGGTLAVTGATTLSSTLAVTGASTLTGNVSTAGTLAVTGASTLTGNVSTAGTLAVTGTSTLTGAATLGSTLTIGGQTNLVTGTSAIAPILYTSGTNLTSATVGASEFDGVNFYKTIDSSSGRGATAVEQYFHLTTAGSTISTIANYFGSTSNISLVPSGYYLIDVYAWFLNTTSGTVVWTLTNSAAPTSQNIFYEMSPATGIVAPPGTATALVGQIYNDTTAAKALSATAALTDAVNHYMHMKIYLQNGSGTSLKIQATKSAGTITPGINSYWFCRRISPGNIGTFAA